VVAESTDMARLGELYRLYGDTVARWSARLGGPEADVEDLVQEVFLVIARKFKGFRGASKVETWLFGITANVVRNRRRREHRWGWLKSLAEQAARSMPTSAADPSESLEQRETAARFYRVLDGLSEAQRNAMILFDVEGLSGEEIAELTGVRPETVFMRLMRGRRQFKRRFEKIEGRR
jgi:RNA polymerase sigma-70 factor (ECF subfamily)